MKVSKTGGTKGASQTRKAAAKPAPEGAGFADALKAAEGPSEAATVSGAAGVGGVEAILAVQQTADATAHRSRGLLLAHGTDLLDRLEDLRHSILLGRVSKEVLHELARKLRERKISADDPKLNDLISDIELRVEVEIAKLTR